MKRNRLEEKNGLHDLLFIVYQLIQLHRIVCIENASYIIIEPRLLLPTEEIPQKIDGQKVRLRGGTKVVNKPFEPLRIRHIIADDEVKHTALVRIEKRRDMFQ